MVLASEGRTHNTKMLCTIRHRAKKLLISIQNSRIVQVRVYHFFEGRWTTSSKAGTRNLIVAESSKRSWTPCVLSAPLLHQEEIWSLLLKQFHQSLNSETANGLEMECDVRVIRKAIPVSRGLFSAGFKTGWKSDG